MRKPSRPWTTKDDKIFREIYPYLSMAEICKQMNRTKSAVKTYAQLHKIKKHPDFYNVDYFLKGHKPWNKGKKYPPDYTHPTLFGKGYQPPNKREIGAERMSVYGVLERKVGEGHREWKPVKKIVWEAVNGPVPKGHVLTMKNGDPMDCRIENIQMLTRMENIARNRPTGEKRSEAAKVGWIKRKASRECHAQA